MPFIPIDKMKQLREAAKNGDERAKKILRAQLDGKDYGADLDSYFAPKQAPQTTQGSFSMPAKEPGEMPKGVGTGNPQLDEWLRSNGIHETDEDYEDALNEYYMEYPEQRPAEEEKEDRIPGLPQQMSGLKAYQDEQAASEEVADTKQIAKSIIDAISSCDKASLSIMQNENLDATVRKGAMATLQEVKQALLDSAEKLTKIKSSLEGM